MITHIPHNATTIKYLATNGKKGEYSFWSTGNKWHWQTLGNCGEEDTAYAAQSAARNWIAEGVKSLPRSRKLS